MPESDLPPIPGPTFENLTNRYELIRIIGDSHLRWRDRAEDPHLKEIHQALVEHFDAVLEQYKVLIDALETKH